MAWQPFTPPTPWATTSTLGIEVYEDDERSSVKRVLHTIRQQELREEQTEYLAMSDFIAPKGSRVMDYIGLLAVHRPLSRDRRHRHGQAHKKP